MVSWDIVPWNENLLEVVFADSDCSGVDKRLLLNVSCSKETLQWELQCSHVPITVSCHQKKRWNDALEYLVNLSGSFQTFPSDHLFMDCLSYPHTFAISKLFPLAKRHLRCKLVPQPLKSGTYIVTENFQRLVCRLTAVKRNWWQSHVPTSAIKYRRKVRDKWRSCFCVPAFFT